MGHLGRGLPGRTHVELGPLEGVDANLSSLCRRYAAETIKGMVCVSSATGVKTLSARDSASGQRCRDEKK